MGELFDLSAQKQNELEVASVTINHPATGVPTGIVIKVYSPDSDKYRRASMNIRNNTLKFARKNNGATAERIDEDGLELLVHVTVGWEGLADNGQPYAFSADNARRLYRQFPFIREQVDEFIGDRRNFMKA